MSVKGALSTRVVAGESVVVEELAHGGILSFVKMTLAMWVISDWLR